MSALWPADCAGEAGQVGLDPVGDLAAVEHSNHRSRGSAVVLGVGSGVGGLGPDAAVEVDADAVRSEPLGPYIRRLDNEPSSAMSKPDSRPAKDSATTSVEPSGVTTIPLVN